MRFDSEDKTKQRQRRAPRPAPRRPQVDSRWRQAAVLIFSAALFWRLFYLYRLQHSPLGDSLTADAQVYWMWAGQLKSDGYHATNPFFLGPLYPYFLRAARTLVGDSIQRILWLQACGGAAAVILLADAARRITSTAIGIGVGLYLCVYEMAVFFDGLVLAESLLFLFEAALLWCVVRIKWHTARPLHSMTLGLLIGLLSEGRATSSLLLLPALLLIVTTVRNRPVRSVSAIVLGFAMVAVPVELRNYAVSRELIPFTYNWGYNLYVGNHPGATGGYDRVTGTEIAVLSPRTLDGGAGLDGREYLSKTTGLQLSPLRSSRYWASEALAFIRTHPGEAAGSVFRKLTMWWNRREYAQIEHAAEYRLVAGPLGLPIVGTFAFLGPLALAGLLVAWTKGPAARFMCGYAFTTTIGVLPFFVTDRYRHHLIPAAALLAAIAVEHLWQDHRRWTAWVGILVGVGVVNLPAPELGGDRYEWGVAADVGSRWLDAGRPDLAMPYLERALHIEQQAGRRIRGSATATERAALYHDYATVLTRSGQTGEALKWYEEALRVAPQDAALADAFAGALESAGRIDEARRIRAILPTLVGGHARLLASRGWKEAQAGRLEEAEHLFESALAEDSQQFDVWTALIRAKMQRDRLDEAHQLLTRAAQAGLPSASLNAHAALLAALAGDTNQSRAALARVPAAAVAGDPVLTEVVEQTKRVLTRPAEKRVP